MDDVKSSFVTSLILIISLGTCLASATGNIEYISPEYKSELEKTFAEADFSNKADIKQKQWTCDMYGMRTRMQVKRGVKLYQWNNAADWKNQGAQIVRSYEVKDRSLLGTKDRFEDRVKLTAQGKLISRLSLTEPHTQVVAYSVCTAAQ